MPTKKPRIKKQQSIANKQRCTTIVDSPETPRQTAKVQSSLVLAYRATDYVAFSNRRDFLIRIGHHSLIIDRLLTRMKTKNGAFITACNHSASAGVLGLMDTGIVR
jgi:hypothetical protein